MYATGLICLPATIILLWEQWYVVLYVTGNQLIQLLRYEGVLLPKPNHRPDANPDSGMTFLDFVRPTSTKATFLSIPSRFIIVVCYTDSQHEKIDEANENNSCTQIPLIAFRDNFKNYHDSELYCFFFSLAWTKKPEMVPTIYPIESWMYHENYSWKEYYLTTKFEQGFLFFYAVNAFTELIL